MKGYGFIIFLTVMLFIASGYCYDRKMVGVCFALAASGVVVLLLGPFITQNRR